MTKAQLRERIVEMSVELSKLKSSQDADISRMVDAFLAWPLPESVCSDLCVTECGYPHRSGTNLLTATEARKMVEHILNP